MWGGVYTNISPNTPQWFCGQDSVRTFIGVVHRHALKVKRTVRKGQNILTESAFYVH